MRHVITTQVRIDADAYDGVHDALVGASRATVDPSSRDRRVRRGGRDTRVRPAHAPRPPPSLGGPSWRSRHARAPRSRPAPARRRSAGRRGGQDTRARPALAPRPLDVARQVSLYPRLSVGGYVIIDDWHLHGAREAVHDYRAAHGVTGALLPVPTDFGTACDGVLEDRFDRASPRWRCDGVNNRRLAKCNHISF